MSLSLLSRATHHSVDGSSDVSGAVVSQTRFSVPNFLACIQMTFGAAMIAIPIF